MQKDGGWRKSLSTLRSLAVDRPRPEDSLAGHGRGYFGGGVAVTGVIVTIMRRLISGDRFMWNFIDGIPQANLSAWYRILTFFAIGLPILGATMGGVCGWGAFRVSNRIGDLQAVDLRQAQQTAKNANITLQYLDVSKLNAVGLSGLAGTGLVENSGLNTILGPYVHLDPGNFHWDCTRDSVAAYDAAIQFESKFPFSYYYRGTCKKANKVEGWERDLDTARKILLITTQIPGHNVHHDEVLKLIDLNAGHLE